MIWKAYRYFYYRLLLWNRNLWGSGDGPEYNALIGVTVISFINLFSIPFLIEAIADIRLIEFPEINKGLFFLLFSVFIIIHYFALVFKKKHIEIEHEFSKETHAAKRKGGILVVGFILVSFFLLFGSWYVIYLRNV